MDSYGDGCSNSCNTCQYTDCCVDVPDEATLVWLTSAGCPPTFSAYCV